MKTKLLAAGVAVLFACMSAVCVAAETTVDQEESKMEEKQKEPLYGARCPSPCGFTVKSHDKQEVVAVLKQHAKSHHEMELSDEEAEKKVKNYKR